MRIGTEVARVCDFEIKNVKDSPSATYLARRLGRGGILLSRRQCL